MRNDQMMLLLRCEISTRLMTAVGLRSHGSEMPRPVYLQQRTYLRSVATAVECQQQSSFAAQTGPKGRTICFRELARPAPDMAPMRPPIPYASHLPPAPQV